MSSVVKNASTDVVDDSGIRPFQEKDRRAVQMLIGQGVMEGLTELNRQTYFHPTVLAVVIVLAGILDYSLGWLPYPGLTWSYFAPLIGVGILALPGMAYVELMNRGHFDALLRTTLGSLDLASPSTYYQSPTSPFSGLFVLSHKNDIIALIALDASARAGEPLSSVIPAEEAGGEKIITIVYNAFWMMLGGKSPEKKTPAVVGKNDLKAKKAAAAGKKSLLAPPPAGSGLAQIRHLYVESQYRQNHIASDLIAHALAHASGVKEVIVLRPSHAGKGAKVMLKKQGFTGRQRGEGWEEVQGISGLGGLVNFGGEWVGLDVAGRKGGKGE